MPSSLPAPHAAGLHLGQIRRGHSQRLAPSRCSARIEVAVVGGDRRRHDRTAAPLQLRAGGAGRRQYRLGRCSAASAPPARSRAPPPMCAPARAGRSPGMFHSGLPAAVHAVRRAAGRLHPARRARRRAAGGGLEDGGEIRIHCADPRTRGPTRWCCSSTFLLTVFVDLTDRHRGRRRARRLPVPASHGGSGRGRERHRARHAKTRPTQRRAHRLRRRAGHRSRCDGLPHQRRVVLRRHRARSAPCSTGSARRRKPSCSTSATCR